MRSGNHESAGKRRSGRTLKGNCWLKQLLVQAAWAASHTKGTYLAVQYRRLAKRRGRKRVLRGHGTLPCMPEAFYNPLAPLSVTPTPL